VVKAEPHTPTRRVWGAERAWVTHLVG